MTYISKCILAALGFGMVVPNVSFGDTDVASCYGFVVHKSSGGGYRVHENNGRHYGIGMHLYYLPDSPNKCNGFNVPTSSNRDANLVIGCQDRKNIIIGSSSTDFICGGPFADTLKGGRSNDFINGRAGNDIINGNTGQDFLRGGKGNDKINGGNGEDCLLGDKGNDILSGDKLTDACEANGGTTSSCEKSVSIQECDRWLQRRYWNR